MPKSDGVKRERRYRGGKTPLDSHVYKVRVMMPTGSQSHYYSEPDLARNKAARAKAAGSLLYFARYRLDQELSIDD